LERVRSNGLLGVRWFRQRLEPAVHGASRSIKPRTVFGERQQKPAAGLQRVPDVEGCVEQLLFRDVLQYCGAEDVVKLPIDLLRQARQCRAVDPAGKFRQTGRDEFTQAGAGPGSITTMTLISFFTAALSRGPSIV